MLWWFKHSDEISADPSVALTNHGRCQRTVQEGPVVPSEEPGTQPDEEALAELGSVHLSDDWKVLQAHPSQFEPRRPATLCPFKNPSVRPWRRLRVRQPGHGIHALILRRVEEESERVLYVS